MRKMIGGWSAQILDRVSWILFALYAVDRLLKLLAVEHFFRHRPPAEPVPWPSVTLLQPITRGVTNLAGALAARRMLDYPGELQHVLICDGDDGEILRVCRSFIATARRPGKLIVLEAPPGMIASKIAKLQAGLDHASGAVLCFVDDDILLRPDALRRLVPFLFQPGTGAVFGLACYVSWHNLPTSLMSTFVNANALLTYVPLRYLVDPWTITGHCYAVRHDDFWAAGGFDGMGRRVGDDHELARRLRHIGLRSVQTPIIYDVENDMPTLNAYAAQIKRWSIFPREAMLPMLTSTEKAAALGGSIGNLLPGLIALLALAGRRRSAQGALLATLSIFAAGYAWCEARHLGRHTPLTRWPLLLITALVTPFHALVALNSGGAVVWRGRRLLVRRGGEVEVIGARLEGPPR